MTFDLFEMFYCAFPPKETFIYEHVYMHVCTLA